MDFAAYRSQLLQQRQGEIALWQLVRNFSRWFFDLLRNFVYRVCGSQGGWEPGAIIDQAVEQVRERVGDGRVICGLSGGVDSAVAAALIARAVGDQLQCIFVDTGLLRQGEAEQVVQTFRDNLKTNPRGLNEAEIVRIIGDDVRVEKVQKLLSGPGYVLATEVKNQIRDADTS